MKLLGVDYGRRRVGFASGELSSLLVFPLGSVVVETLDEAIKAVDLKAREEGVEKIVVGMPYRLGSNDEKGEMVEEVRSFVEALRERVQVPVETEDERLTTTMAERMRKEAGEAGKVMDIDAGAATLILESFVMRESQDSDQDSKGLD